MTPLPPHELYDLLTSARPPAEIAATLGCDVDALATELLRPTVQQRVQRQQRLQRCRVRLMALANTHAVITTLQQLLTDNKADVRLKAASLLLELAGVLAEAKPAPAKPGAPASPTPSAPGDPSAEALLTQLLKSLPTGATHP
jgi:hypothetical protein